MENLIRHIERTVLHPYGRGKGPSFTLSLYDTGIPHPGGGTWRGFRFYQHHKGMKSGVLFQGTEAPGRDPIPSILDRLTRAPGDTPDESTADASPDQLTFLLQHAPAVRREAARRFAWDVKTANLRADLEVVYQARHLRGPGARHRMTLGVLTAQGATKAEARESLISQIGHQVSAVPVFRVGALTGLVYARYPHGEDTVLQTVDPRRPEAPLGDSLRFKAANQRDAEEIAETMIAEAERRAPPAPPSRPSVRPSARSMRPRVPSIRAFS